MPRRRGLARRRHRLFRGARRAMLSAVNERWKPSTRQCSPLRCPTCALCDRDHLPARSTLSRFVTALTQEPVEALRSLFLTDLLSRPLSQERATGDLVDREGSTRVVFDIDGTREAARQRALPQTEDLPAASRRLDARLWPLATQGASVGKSFVLARLSARLTAISGSARLARRPQRAQPSKNSARLWRLSVGTLLHTSCSRSAP